MKQVTLNGDVYYTHFQNAYSSINDPQNTQAHLTRWPKATR